MLVAAACWQQSWHVFCPRATAGSYCLYQLMICSLNAAKLLCRASFIWVCLLQLLHKCQPVTYPMLSRKVRPGQIYLCLQIAQLHLHCSQHITVCIWYKRSKHQQAQHDKASSTSQSHCRQQQVNHSFTQLQGPQICRQESWYANSKTS